MLFSSPWPLAERVTHCLIHRIQRQVFSGQPRATQHHRTRIRSSTIFHPKYIGQKSQLKTSRERHWTLTWNTSPFVLSLHGQNFEKFLINYDWKLAISFQYYSKMNNMQIKTFGQKIINEFFSWVDVSHYLFTKSRLALESVSSQRAYGSVTD